jgi:tetratricopeptide (TPR) repeat protein
VELDPSPENLVQLARSLLRRGDTAGGLALAGRALAADPALPAARAVAAEARFLDGDYDQAREHAIAALRQDPRNADARAVVEACARMVQDEPAGPGGDAADSSHPEHLGHQAEDALLKGDGAAAIALAAQNLRRNPGSPLAVECWAHIVQELDVPLEQVGPIMASFAAAFPQHPGVAFRFGELLAHHGWTGEALGWFERVLELDPDDALARHNADVLRMRAGR